MKPAVERDRTKRRLSVIATALAVAQPATAGDRDFLVQPVPAGTVTAVYTHGTASAMLRQHAGVAAHGREARQGWSISD